MGAHDLHSWFLLAASLQKPGPKKGLETQPPSQPEEASLLPLPEYDTRHGPQNPGPLYGSRPLSLPPLMPNSASIKMQPGAVLSVQRCLQAQLLMAVTQNESPTLFRFITATSLQIR